MREIMNDCKMMRISEQRGEVRINLLFTGSTHSIGRETIVLIKYCSNTRMNECNVIVPT